MSFFSELNRRNVFRVGAAYAVTAWLLIQVAETIFPLFGFDDTPARIVVVVLAIGLIPTLVLAWAFEWTPEGLKRDADVDRSQPVTVANARRLDRIIIAVLALALGYFAFDKFVLDPARDAEIAQAARQEGRADAIVESYGEQSIAVLPFVNMSADPEQEYFSDGMAEELLNLLARIPELRVISRSSSFTYKDSSASLPEIAAELGVSYIVEGSVRKAGNTVRITAQLIEARPDRHLWSANYDRQLEDVFAIQDEIAGQVAEALEISLLETRPAVVETSPEVYSLFLRARHFDNLKGEPNWARAVEYYRQALAIEPDYAPAWAGLARTYRYQANNHLRDFEVGMALARDAAERAIELDQSPAAWANLAQIEMLAEWDWKAAESALDKAMHFGPGDAEVLSAAGDLALVLGRTGDAVEYFRRSLSRDPLSLTAHNALGIARMNAGEFSGARASFSQLLELSPDYPWGHINMGRVLLLEGAPAQALEHFEWADTGPWRGAGMALALDALGRRAEADAELAELEGDYASSAAFLIAVVYAGRRDNELAFAWLERAYERHEPGLMYTVRDPILASLYDDPRWAELLERMALPLVARRHVDHRAGC